MRATKREDEYDWSKPVYMTEDEFLDFVCTTDEKYEFYDGWVRPLTKLIGAVPQGMAGGSENHALIGANVIVAAALALRNSDCRVYNSDLYVKAKSDARWSFPDTSIVCGPSEKDVRKKEALNNPCVIIEVLSPTTEAFDRSKKFEKYARIEALRHYVLVETSRPAVQVLTRGEDGEWMMRYYNGRADNAELSTLGVALDLLY